MACATYDMSTTPSMLPDTDHPTRSGMSRERNAVPAGPSLLLVMAAASPATNVPWPAKSRGSLSSYCQSSPGVTPPEPDRLTKSQPCTSSMKPLPSSSKPGIPPASAVFVQNCPDDPATVPPRSGCDGRIPVSRMAMTIDESPAEMSQADVALMPGGPRYHHDDVNIESFGTSWTGSTAIGSALATSGSARSEASACSTSAPGANDAM